EPPGAGDHGLRPAPPDPRGCWYRPRSLSFLLNHTGDDHVADLPGYRRRVLAGRLDTLDAGGVRLPQGEIAFANPLPVRLAPVFDPVRRAGTLGHGPAAQGSVRPRVEQDGEVRCQPARRPQVDLTDLVR